MQHINLSGDEGVIFKNQLSFKILNWQILIEK